MCIDGARPNNEHDIADDNGCGGTDYGTGYGEDSVFRINYGFASGSGCGPDYLDPELFPGVTG